MTFGRTMNQLQQYRYISDRVCSFWWSKTTACPRWWNTQIQWLGGRCLKQPCSWQNIYYNCLCHIMGYITREGLWMQILFSKSICDSIREKRILARHNCPCNCMWQRKYLSCPAEVNQRVVSIFMVVLLFYFFFCHGLQPGLPSAEDVDFLIPGI